MRRMKRATWCIGRPRLAIRRTWSTSGGPRIRSNPVMRSPSRLSRSRAARRSAVSRRLCSRMARLSAAGWFFKFWRSSQSSSRVVKELKLDRYGGPAQIARSKIKEGTFAMLKFFLAWTIAVVPPLMLAPALRAQTAAPQQSGTTENQKPAPASPHDISGIWDPGNNGIQPLGPRAMPDDGKPEHQLPYTPLGLETLKAHKPSNGV